MSRTVDRLHSILVNNKNISQMTPGVKADFGFDSNIYLFCNQKQPSLEQLNLLYNRYKELFNLKYDVANEIHSIIKSGCTASFQLKRLLGNEFNWICITNDMFNYSNK